MAFILRMPRWTAPLTLLCLLVSAHGAARATERGGKELGKESQALKKELKKAEGVLSKLRRLGEA
ncbi:MAG TPA: hypothetical protein VF508_04715, partial [Pyrinomonadaceae bacterium]